MSSVARSCTEAALTANAKVFATIGSLIGNPIGCAISTILSLGFLAFLLAGAGDIEFEDELQNLYVFDSGSHCAVHRGLNFMFVLGGLLKA